MRKIIADLSRLICAATGGPRGKTLCWRAAMRWGDNCLFCRLIGWAMREPHHCYDELTASDLWARIRRRGKH